MEEPMKFRKVDAKTFEAARSEAVHAVRELAPLTPAELAAGWRADPASGLRRNLVTGAWDDGCFVHVAPKRPS
jgi:hypothetical protein